jgi:hypothetical protein
VPGGLFVGIGFVASICWLALAWRGRAGAWSRELAFGGWFFMTITPSLAVAMFSVSETPLAERYLYIPSAGVCLLLGFLLERAAATLLSSAGPPIYLAATAVVTLVLVIPSSIATLDRAAVWSDDLSFWLDTVEKAPDEGIPHLHLGLRYQKMAGQTDDRDEREQSLEMALAEYEKALHAYRGAGGRSKALNNMGSIHLSRGHYEEAIESFRGALRESPRYPTAHYHWALAEANLALRARDSEKGHEHISNALLHFVNPRYPKALLRYGELLIAIGRVLEGREKLQRLIQVAPTTPEARDARRLLAQG